MAIWEKSGPTIRAVAFATEVASSSLPPPGIFTATTHPADSTKRSRPSCPPSSGKTGSGELCRDMTSGLCAVTMSRSLFICMSSVVKGDLRLVGWGKKGVWCAPWEFSPPLPHSASSTAAISTCFFCERVW